MTNKTYSKTWTDFETQCMTFTKLRMGFPNLLVRGHDGFLKIYRPTADHHNPVHLMTIHVRASKTKDEVGFFKKEEQNEWLLIGGDVAWTIVDKVTPLLKP